MSNIIPSQRDAQLRSWQARLDACEHAFIDPQIFRRLLTPEQWQDYRAHCGDLREQRAMLNSPLYDINGDALLYYKKTRIIPARIARAETSRDRKAVLRRINDDAERRLEDFEMISPQEQAAFRPPTDEEMVTLYGNVLEHELPVLCRHRDHMSVPENIRRAAQLAAIERIMQPPPDPALQAQVICRPPKLRSPAEALQAASPLAVLRRKMMQNVERQDVSKVVNNAAPPSPVDMPTLPQCRRGDEIRKILQRLWSERQAAEG